MTDFSISLLMDALVLLRNSFTIPKLQYLLRTSPCFLSASLQCYDNILRSVVTSVTNTRLENNDPAWLQATLPVKMGGLEIRSAVQVDLLAFLASSHVSSDLVSTILPPRFHSLSASLCDEALALWSQGHNMPAPSGTSAYQQKSWDQPRACVFTKHLLVDAKAVVARVHCWQSQQRSREHGYKHCLLHLWACSWMMTRSELLWAIA